MKEKSISEQDPCWESQAVSSSAFKKLMEISREGLESLVTAIKRKKIRT